MARYSFLAVSALFVSSTLADFSFNTTTNSRGNGQIGNPWAQLQSQGATDSCLTAYGHNIKCDPILLSLSLNPAETRSNQTNLEKGCGSSTCESSIAGFFVNLFKACTNQPSTVTIFTNTNEDLYMLKYYWGFCTKDLTNGTYCLTEQNPTYLGQGSNTKAEIDAACADTCWTQNSAAQYNAYGKLNLTEGLGADVSKVCPNVDISKYDVVQPLSDIASGVTSTTTSSSATGSVTPIPTSVPVVGRPSTTTVGTASHTATPGAAAATSAKPGDAAALARGVVPVAWAAVAFALVF